MEPSLLILLLHTPVTNWPPSSFFYMPHGTVLESIRTQICWAGFDRFRTRTEVHVTLEPQFHTHEPWICWWKDMKSFRTGPHHAAITRLRKGRCWDGLNPSVKPLDEWPLVWKKEKMWTCSKWTRAAKQKNTSDGGANLTPWRTNDWSTQFW